ncbi:hypothetical protein WG66_014496 [Moniliophthora roreri]|nr:hypothetical protein WG66_014496 [Moniliophthora roreri]
MFTVVVRHLNVAQLFGYSDDQYGLPALIFYDALIPLNRVLLSNRSKQWPRRVNCWVELYFCLQVTAAKIVEGFLGTVYIALSLYGGNVQDPNKLWIEPRSGALREGPRVQSDANLLRRLSDAPPTSHLNPLSVQTYSDTNTVLDYLTRIFPIGTIFNQVGDQDHRWGLTVLQSWPYLANLLWKRNQQRIIARWTGLREIPQYVCVDCNRSLQECKVVMKDGSVRERLDIESAWLAQAHSILSQLGIHEDEWEKYSIIEGLNPTLYTHEKENADITSNTHIPYLFVRPIPRLSDDETTWRSWAESTYFWSLDPSGQEEMSESTKVFLGLPSFKTRIDFRCKSWNIETYKVIKRYQGFKGFDPTTTDYARSLGYPLIQVVGDADRLQELGGSNNDCSTSEVSCPNTAHYDVIPSSIPNDTPVNDIPGTQNDEAIADLKTSMTDPVTQARYHFIPLRLNFTLNPCIYWTYF